MFVRENCCFFKCANANGCSILIRLSCVGCNFFKTKQEFEKGRAKALSRLKLKYDKMEFDNIVSKYRTNKTKEVKK